MNKILLVDDDVDLVAMLSQYLRREGFEADAAHDGLSGAAQALQGDYQLVVLDIMMPKASGFEALRRIRAGSQVPVLMLTARGDQVDRIVGLDMGADDYVPKPCAPGELVARVRAILRRTGARDTQPDAWSTQPLPLAPPSAPARGPMQAGPLTLMPGSRRATWHGHPLELTGTEFSVLEVLARHVGQLVSKPDISMQAFGRPLARFDRRIDVHVSAIRQKLGPRADGQPWIQSVRGLGYQLLED